MGVCVCLYASGWVRALDLESEMDIEDQEQNSSSTKRNVLVLFFSGKRSFPPEKKNAAPLKSPETIS